MRNLLFDRYGIRPEAMLVIAALLILAIIGGALYFDHRDNSKCEARGGHMVKTGERTTYVLVGKVLVPTTTDVKECFTN